MNMKIIRDYTQIFPRLFKGFIAIVILMIAISCRPATISNNNTMTSDDQREVQSLIEGLKNQDPEVRIQAILSFHEEGCICKEALPALIEGLKDPNATVAAWSAEILGHFGPSAEEAIMPLIESFKVQSNFVRGETYEALWKIGEPAMVALIEAFKNQDPDIRIGAVNFFTNEHGWTTLPYADKITSALLKCLDDEDADFSSDAAYMLAENRLRPDIVIPKLISELTENNYDIRETGCSGLAYYGAAAFPALDRLLLLAENDEKEGVRKQAIETIGLIGPSAKDAVPRLIKLINSSEKGMVIGTLTKIGPEQGVLEILLKLLRTGDEDARSAVAGSIDAFGPKPEIVSALIKALKDKSTWVQSQAIWSLEKFGSSAKPALPALRRLAKTTNDKDLKETVQSAIYKIEKAVGKEDF